jgi:Fic family protein
MHSDNFNGNAGTVVHASTEKHGTYNAFMPKPLPVELDVNDLSELLERAAKELGKLNGMIKLLPNPYLLTKPYTQKEAVMSSMIEGTLTSFEDVLIAEAGGSIDKEGNPRTVRRGDDIIEVRNLIAAIEEGVESIKTSEIDLPLLLRLHRILMTNVRGNDKHMGSLRSVQNWIGAPGTKVQDAKYVPPPPEYVSEQLDNMLNYMRAKDKMPKLIRIAIAHYQFEAIHPFEDGNGRIGRAMVILYLIKEGLLDMPMLYLSEYFEKNRTLYYDLLFKVSQKGAYDEWTSFFLNGVVEQSIKVAEKAGSLLRYSTETKKRMNNERSTHLVNVFESLLSNPFVTITGISDKEGISYPAAKHIVEKLIKYGILSLVGKNTRGKVYASQDILDILNG